ncbi:MAG: hypothetical protein Q4G67_14030 [Actinomycetia bacterium]|nr:hypothetical protein [Actinomycetes bacterium]
MTPGMVVLLALVLLVLLLFVVGLVMRMRGPEEDPFEEYRQPLAEGEPAAEEKSNEHAEHERVGALAGQSTEAVADYSAPQTAHRVSARPEESEGDQWETAQRSDVAATQAIPATDEDRVTAPEEASDSTSVAGPNPGSDPDGEEGNWPARWNTFRVPPQSSLSGPALHADAPDAPEVTGAQAARREATETEQPVSTQPELEPTPAQPAAETADLAADETASETTSESAGSEPARSAIEPVGAIEQQAAAGEVEPAAVDTAPDAELPETGVQEAAASAAQPSRNPALQTLADVFGMAESGADVPVDAVPEAREADQPSTSSDEQQQVEPRVSEPEAPAVAAASEAEATAVGSTQDRVAASTRELTEELQRVLASLKEAAIEPVEPEPVEPEPAEPQPVAPAPAAAVSPEVPTPDKPAASAAPDEESAAGDSEPFTWPDWLERPAWLDSGLDSVAPAATAPTPVSSEPEPEAQDEAPAAEEREPEAAEPTHVPAEPAPAPAGSGSPRSESAFSWPDWLERPSWLDETRPSRSEEGAPTEDANAAADPEPTGEQVPDVGSTRAPEPEPAATLSSSAAREEASGSPAPAKKTSFEWPSWLERPAWLDDLEADSQVEIEGISLDAKSTGDDAPAGAKDHVKAEDGFEESPEEPDAEESVDDSSTDSSADSSNDTSRDGEPAPSGTPRSTVDLDWSFDRREWARSHTDGSGAGGQDRT